MYAIIVASKTFYRENIVIAINDIRTELAKHKSHVYFGLSDSDGHGWLIGPDHKSRDAIIDDLKILEVKVSNCEI